MAGRAGLVKPKFRQKKNDFSLAKCPAMEYYPTYHTTGSVVSCEFIPCVAPSLSMGFATGSLVFRPSAGNQMANTRKIFDPKDFLDFRHWRPQAARVCRPDLDY